MKIIVRDISTLVLILLLSTCLTSQDYSVAQIPDSLIKNANAVIRLHDTQVFFNEIDEMEVEEEFVVTVLNKRASHFLDFKEYYNENSSKIKNIKIEYLDKNGEVIYKPKKKEIDDRSAFDGFSLISSSRHKYFDYETDQYPVTLSYSIKKVSSTTCFIPSWRLSFGPRVSIEKSQFLLVNSSDIKINSKRYNLKSIAFEQVGETQFLLKNQPAYRSERNMPPTSEWLPKIVFSPIQFNYENNIGKAGNWSEYGTWIKKTFLDDQEPFDNSQTKSKLDLLLKSSKSMKDTVSAIYNFVQENTRYISIQLGEGGFKPMSSKAVDQNKYGDCKALSFYAMNLLKIYDIPTNYIIVNANSNSKVSLDPEYYSHEQANHAIINVPAKNDTFWLDCTSDVAPFNMLGSFTDDRYVLEIGDNGIQVLKTPDYGQTMNTQIVNAAVGLTDDNGISVDFKQDFHGLKYSSIVYKSKLNKKDQEEYLKESLFKKFNEVDNLNYSYDFDEGQYLAQTHYSFISENYSETLGDYINFPIRFLDLGIPKFKKTKKRHFDIHFQRAFKNESFITYKLPENYNYSEKKYSSKLQSKYGEYFLEYYSDQNSDEIIVKRTFQLNEGKYDKLEHDDIKLFFDKVRKEEQRTITIDKRT